MNEQEYLAQVAQDEREALDDFTDRTTLDAFWPPKKRKKGKSWHKRYRNWRLGRKRYKY